MASYRLELWQKRMSAPQLTTEPSYIFFRNILIIR